MYSDGGFTEGDHIKITASMYPFPTVCADKQSTDWFHAISRTLKWNERERQKSFVVVEEKSPVLQKHQGDTPASGKTKISVRSPSGEIEEGNEVSDEEEAIFDIDDSSSEARATASAGIQTFEDAALGHEKAVEQLALGRTERVATLRPRHGLRSRSRVVADDVPIPLHRRANSQELRHQDAMQVHIIFLLSIPIMSILIYLNLLVR